MYHCAQSPIGQQQVPYRKTEAVLHMDAPYAVLNAIDEVPSIFF